MYLHYKDNYKQKINNYIHGCKKINNYKNKINVYYMKLNQINQLGWPIQVKLYFNNNYKDFKLSLGDYNKKIHDYKQKNKKLSNLPQQIDHL